MSKTTLVTQQVQLQEWFQMMQESKGRSQQIPLDEWCKENYGISAAGYYYRVSALSKGGFSMHTNPVIMIARC